MIIFVAFILRKAYSITSSVSSSIFAVASSNINIFASCKKARAKASNYY